MDITVAYGNCVFRFVYFGNLCESFIAFSFLYNIVCRNCGFFKAVRCGLPFKAVVVPVVFCDGESMYGQRLNHVCAAVAVRKEFEHTLIYGT